MTENPLYPESRAALEKRQPMAGELPARARVVIIGGGVIGCSLAYHLTKLGWRDVVLLERKQLTCGTTWHAAGLVTQLRATENMTRLAQYTQELYATLEAETGQATGFTRIGSISVPSNAARVEEFRRASSMARCFGVDVHEISPREVKRAWPIAYTDDILAGFYTPKDARTNPIDTTLALAKGAKMGGAQIFEDTKVTAINQKNGRVAGVVTERGEIQAEYVVNCCGMWARQVGRMAGVDVPLHAAEHYYLITEPMQGLSPEMPILRDPDRYAYYREETGRLMLGLFEPVAAPWGEDGIPKGFAFGELPADWARMEPFLEGAMGRIPGLKEVGIQVFFNGPESFTPDDRFLIGEAPKLKNFFVAAGFNSLGVLSAGGVGKVLSEWIVAGEPQIDIWEVDLTRMLPFQSNPRYLRERTVEVLGWAYGHHWPNRQFETARGVRRSVLHDRLAKAGAFFGQAAGFERAEWFAPAGIEPHVEYSYGRQNWFAFHAEEHRAAREDVVLFDESFFAKFLVQGRDAAKVLDIVSANEVDVPVGRCTYTQWLNNRGTVEADLTVTRLGDDRYLVMTASTTHFHVYHWLKRHIPADSHAFVSDVTSGWVMLNVQGPKSRQLLSRLTSADLSNQAFPYLSLQEIDLAYARVQALRISYMGELGWELYIPTDFAQSVYDEILKEGEEFKLRHAGIHTLFSLRIEKAYRSFGHDIGPDDTPLEAGLGFAVDFQKSGGFIGREALLRQKEAGVLKRRLVQFLLLDPEPLMYHNEPIYRDGQLVGYTRSAAYGHTLGGCVALGYVHNSEGVDRSFIEEGSFEIEVAGARYPASASLRAMYDPQNVRVRS